MTQTVYYNVTLATMDEHVDKEYGLLREHVLCTEDAHIRAILPQTQVSREMFPAAEWIDCAGALMTPGLIDCHTHTLFGGSRAQEWEMRLAGASYEEISRAGGGILSTVKATRAATAEELLALGMKRTQAMAQDGVTTVEVKSGYGLSLEAERKLLTVARALQAGVNMEIVPTLLAAHSIPPEYAQPGTSGAPSSEQFTQESVAQSTTAVPTVESTGQSTMQSTVAPMSPATAYMDEICTHIIPTLWAEGLYEAVDIFVENIAFDVDNARRMYETCRTLGIPVKAHNEQMTNMGGTQLLAEYGGLSSDHIEQLDEAGVSAMASAGTVAVLLPLAGHFLHDAQIPPIALLRKHGVPMAVATDYNPGTSPFTSLRLAMNHACTLYGLTAAEAMQGVTRHAARALGRAATHGILRPGYAANLVLWDVTSPVEIFYELGPNPLKQRVLNGVNV